MTKSDTHDEMVVMGRISGLYGVRGWVKVYSFTSPRENILQYKTWYLREKGNWVPHQLAQGRKHGKGIVALIEGCDDRDVARGWIDTEIAVLQSDLPRLEAGEYYWSDLLELEVVNLQGVKLGIVDHLLETGANDVLVLKGDRERLIPFVQGPVIHEIDLAAKRMIVDWDPED